MALSDMSMSLIRNVSVATVMAAAVVSPTSGMSTERGNTRHYIVVARTTTEARRAVSMAGGRVTGELPIVAAVSADLTERQRTTILRRKSIVRIFPDADVRLADTSAVSNVRDNFATASWSNNDGDHWWATNWAETGDDGSAATGSIAIQPVLVDGVLGAGRLTLKGSGATLSRRAALPPNALHATLTFNAQRQALASGDFVAIQASLDAGAHWSEVGRIQGPGSDSAPQPVTYDLSPFISADTTIRLSTNLPSGLISSLLKPPVVYIDDLQIVYDSVYATGTAYPQTVSADRLHAQGVTGLSVTIAVLDSGYWKNPVVDTNALGLGRVLAQYDAVNDITTPILLGLGTTSTDDAGHGSHVTGIMINSQRTLDGRFFGIAPNANLVSIKAFDANGRGTYSSVIRGIGWAIQNKALYGIRALNLSFGAQPQAHYWEDPLDLAVMRAWQAGIVVVASAGNTGPAAQTITAPGNVPYIITVGAMSDNYTPNDPTDDHLASFSAAGPTYEGFVKPDVIAPGGHLWSLMPTYAQIAQEHPTYQNDGAYFTMSGTSQSAAVVTGVVALLLQAQPGLTPEQVKCKLMRSARPAVDPTGQLAYSVFQQGAGLVNAYDARYAPIDNCENVGLDIAQDLAGTQHYGGPARQDSSGRYYIANSSGYGWNQGYAWNQGYGWNQGYAWNEGYSWNEGYAWNESDYSWQDGSPTSSSTDSSDSSTGINSWVSQE